MEKRKERRAYPRFKCIIPAVVLGGKSLRMSSVLMYNFSEGGVYFEISDPLQAGDIMALRTEENAILDPVGSGTWKQRLAEVRWSKMLGDGTARRYGCGIQYLRGDLSDYNND